MKAGRYAVQGGVSSRNPRSRRVAEPFLATRVGKDGTMPSAFIRRKLRGSSRYLHLSNPTWKLDESAFRSGKATLARRPRHWLAPGRRIDAGRKEDTDASHSPQPQIGRVEITGKVKAVCHPRIHKINERLCQLLSINAWTAHYFNCPALNFEILSCNECRYKTTTYISNRKKIVDGFANMANGQ